MSEQNLQRNFNISNLMRSPKHPIFGFTLRVILILFGDFLGAVAVNNFLVPAHVLAGGITGIAQLIHHYNWRLPIGGLYFFMNIPLFLLGYRHLGKRFLILTGVGIAGFSFFTDYVHVNLATPPDILLMSLYGGVLLGLSTGIVMQAGGSTGGTDIISLVVNRLYGKSIGGATFAMNTVVVLLSMTTFGTAAGMYTLVSMFASSRVINALLHFQNRKTALIVSCEAAKIAKQISVQLGRGSTLFAASGAYTHASTQVLMCALTHLEVAELNQLATQIDANAFITILDTTEVVGHFRHIAM